MSVKKFLSCVGLGEPELPPIAEVIQDEIHQSRLQLLEAQAAAERYTAAVYMFEERIERLLKQRADIEAMHRNVGGFDVYSEEIVAEPPKTRKSMQ